MNRYDPGIFGNRSYLACIDLKANVNWLCFPRFDSTFVFDQWGNFPRKYSHVGLVNAVYRLSTKLNKPIFL